MARQRLPYQELSPELLDALRRVNAELTKSTLGMSLIELIYMRVSQINGCAFCLGLHARNLRGFVKSAQRLDTLTGWRVSGLFNQPERAALAWAVSVTHIANTHAPDEDYSPLKEHFCDREISDLTSAIVLMNAMNRLAIDMRQ